MRQLGRLTRLDLSFTELKNLTLSDLSEAARSLEVLMLSNTQIRQFPKLHDDAGEFIAFIFKTFYIMYYKKQAVVGKKLVQ